MHSAKWIRWLRKKSRSALLRYLYISLFALMLLSFGWGLYRVAKYTGTTERLEIRQVSVSGLDRVSKNEVLARAGYAPGANILRVSLDETRRAVEEILWVRHATVQRVWPDELVIVIVEREPIALGRIGGEIYQVDVDGVILSTDTRTDTSFPVLDGLRPGDIEGNKRKIEAYRAALEAIGQSELSEVRVSDIGEISVVPIHNPVLIDLGSADHRARWEKYVQLRVRIREDYPRAFHIDLRFQDQVIIRTEDNKPAGKIIWGEEKKLL
jgi:cell division protein FtsQ